MFWYFSYGLLITCLIIFSHSFSIIVVSFWTCSPSKNIVKPMENQWFWKCACSSTWFNKYQLFVDVLSFLLWFWHHVSLTFPASIFHNIFNQFGCPHRAFWHLSACWVSYVLLVLLNVCFCVWNIENYENFCTPYIPRRASGKVQCRACVCLWGHK